MALSSTQGPSVGALRARVLAWYDANARALPWRAPPGRPEGAEPIPTGCGCRR